TTGDMILDRTLDQVGGKGLFLKELEKALLDNKADIIVHSLKDVPMILDERLPLVAVTKREDPRDVLVLPRGSNQLDFRNPLGCASKRRSLQLAKLFPQATIKPVRGNVLTRLNKLDQGEYSGLVLAYAGLSRLGLTDRISRIFEPWEILPPAGQGVLAIQARQDFDCTYLRELHDPDTWITAMAERSFVTALDGGCSSPIGAYCTKNGDHLQLTGLYVDEEQGISKIQSIKTTAACCEADGRKLAQTMKSGE
ncbi:MAG: hydroxymethylbilane synthase, partial [Clostridiales bacterium]